MALLKECDCYEFRSSAAGRMRVEFVDGEQRRGAFRFELVG
jgi:hypothetical protein